MPAYPREELEEMMRRWVAANDGAGSSGDWSPMGAFYTEAALYTWNNGHKYEFVARGRDEITRIAFGSEMAGLERWVYPYVRVLIDDRIGEVIGIRRQIAPVQSDDGTPYEIAGTGGSWFRYAGNWQWSWQRDFFDHGNAGVIFQELARELESRGCSLNSTGDTIVLPYLYEWLGDRMTDRLRGCTPSRSGIAPSAGCCCAGTGWESSRYISRRPPHTCSSRRRSRRCSHRS